MASLKHEIIHCTRFDKIKEDNEKHKKAKERAVRNGTPLPEQRGATNNTLQQYVDHAVRFGMWCKQEFGCRRFEECRSHIQDYADYLYEKGRSPSTIHTYLAGVCCAWEVPLSEIEKPLRRTADFTRSRGRKKSDSRKDVSPDASPRLSEFQAVVGIRRNELLRLRRDCLCTDEEGYLCVKVAKGKGGKLQLQRVPPGYEEFVESYFDGSFGFVFSKEEMTNKIDLHHLRHVAAWRAYQGYLKRLEAEPGYREKLEKEIRHRWARFNAKPWKPEQAQGYYRIRGKSLREAKKYGWPTSYDRLAILAVSVYHLAHWRLNVTVNSYILAALRDARLTGLELR